MKARPTHDATASAGTPSATLGLSSKLKTLLVITAIATFAGISVAPRLSAEPAKEARHRIVFELTSDDAQTWDGVLNNVENVKKALAPGSVEIEVVAHGKGLAMLTASRNAQAQERLKKNADAGVIFAACENTMRKQNVKKEQLSPFAKTVDSGVAEVVRKQELGWSYLRSGS